MSTWKPVRKDEKGLPPEYTGNPLCPECGHELTACDLGWRCEICGALVESDEDD
jgi:tRNA(Ile2) C34 agmatinyltransferase TiaS